jgi:hypothetical protein
MPSRGIRVLPLAAIRNRRPKIRRKINNIRTAATSSASALAANTIVLFCDRLSNILAAHSEERNEATISEP